MIKNSLPALSKYIAQSGFCSRRQATELIKAGKVTINGIIVTTPFTPVQKQDVVCADKHPIHQEKKVYILFNKPKNLICSAADEKGRKTVSDFFMPFFTQRLYPIGRLDRTTTGLLIMTNDGDLTQKLSHPKYEVSKTYQVSSELNITKASLDSLMNGIELEDGFMKVDEAFYPTASKKIATVVIHSGKNHIVRRLFEALDHPKIKLDRSQYAGLTKRGLKTGEWRLLTDAEIKELSKSTEKAIETTAAVEKKTNRQIKAKKFFARL